MAQTLDDYLTLHEAARERGVTPQTIRNAIRAGRLQCTRRYGKRLIRRSDLAAVTFRNYKKTLRTATN